MKYQNKFVSWASGVECGKAHGAGDQLKFGEVISKVRLGYLRDITRLVSLPGNAVAQEMEAYCISSMGYGVN